MSDLSDAQKEQIKKIQNIIGNSLARWTEDREKTLALLQEAKMPDVEEVEKMFLIADELTLLIIDKLFVTHHQLSPQVTSVLAAVVLGITNGKGIEEVAKFVNFNIKVLQRQDGDELH